MRLITHRFQDIQPCKLMMITGTFLICKNILLKPLFRLAVLPASNLCLVDRMGCLFSPLSWFLSLSRLYLLSYFSPYFVDENAEWDRPAKCIARSDHDDHTVVRVENLIVEVFEDMAEPDQNDSSLVRLDRIPADILQIIAGFLTSDSEACLILSRK